MSGIHGVTTDPLVISRYWPAARIDSLFRMPAALRPLAYGGGRLLKRRRLHALVTSLGRAYGSDADSRATAAVTAEFRSPAGEVRRRRVSAESVYRFTGTILVATTQAMARRPHPPAGVRAASEMFASIDEVVELTGLSVDAVAS
jgi:hypothetical protein